MAIAAGFDPKFIKINKMKASPKQLAILKLAREKGGYFTKRHAVELLQHDYFHCAGHMVGFQKLDKHRRLTGTGKICGPCNLEKIKALLARKNEEHVPR
jgi:hypothetical protein